MAKVIYIAGLGHSGTTLLDMALGTHHNVIGLGELKTLLSKEEREKHFKSVCSCGKKAIDCEIWGRLKNPLDIEADDISKIEIIINYLSEKYTHDVIIVDSSKNSYKYLEKVNKNYNLSVIYLTRDIRSWSYSRYLNTGKPVLYYLFRWFLENWKIRTGLAKMDIEFLTIGYEELALYPEHILKIIADYTKLTYSESMLQPHLTKSHIISGNVVRADSLKQKKWYYDSRWMTSFRMMILSSLTFPFQRYNRKYVYSNIINNARKEHFIFGNVRRKKISSKIN